eukprot:74552_1
MLCDTQKALEIAIELSLIVNKRQLNEEVVYNGNGRALQILIDDLRLYQQQNGLIVNQNQVLFHFRQLKNYYTEASKYTQSHLNKIESILNASSLNVDAKQIAEGLYVTISQKISKKKNIPLKSSKHIRNKSNINSNSNNNILSLNETESILLSVIFIIQTNGDMIKNQQDYKWSTKKEVKYYWNILCETEKLFVSFNSIFNKLVDRTILQKHEAQNKYLINKISMIEYARQWSTDNTHKLIISKNNIVSIDEEFSQFSHITSIVDLEKCKYILETLQDMGFLYEAIVDCLKQAGNHKERIISFLLNDIDTLSLSPKNIKHETEFKSNSPNNNIKSEIKYENNIKREIKYEINNIKPEFNIVPE